MIALRDPARPTEILEALGGRPWADEADLSRAWRPLSR